MQLANNITLSVYKAAWQAGAPGMTTAQFTALISAGFARCGTSGAASCQTGEWSALPHGSITPQVIREGAIVLIDDGCLIEGYSSDISRTFVYGKATDSPEEGLRCGARGAGQGADRGQTWSALSCGRRRGSQSRDGCGFWAGITRLSRIVSGMGLGWMGTSGRTWCAGITSRSRWGCAFRMSREFI